MVADTKSPQDSIVEKALAGAGIPAKPKDTTISKVQELCSEIEKLRAERDKLRTSLSAANDRVAILEACINTSYAATMPAK